MLTTRLLCVVSFPGSLMRSNVGGAYSAVVAPFCFQLSWKSLPSQLPSSLFLPIAFSAHLCLILHMRSYIKISAAGFSFTQLPESQEPILNTDTNLWRRPWSVRISRLSWCGLSSLKFNSTAWISGFSGLGIRPKRSGILGELVRHCLWVWRWGCLFVIWWLFLPKLSTVPSIESLSKTEGNGRLGLSSLCLPEMRHHLLALMTLVFRGFRLRLGFTPPAMGCQAFVLHNQIPKSPSWRWLTYTCIQNPLMHVCSQFPSFTDPD